MNLESIWGRNYGQRLSDMEIMKLRAMEIMGVRIKITKKKIVQSDWVNNRARWRENTMCILRGKISIICNFKKVTHVR